MNSACIVCIAGGLEGRRPSKKNLRMHALLQEIILDGKQEHPSGVMGAALFRSIRGEGISWPVVRHV
jgi:hypothetical protein